MGWYLITTAKVATGENEDTAGLVGPLDVDIGFNIVVHLLVWNSALTEAVDTLRKNQVTPNIFTGPLFWNATYTCLSEFEN